MKRSRRQFLHIAAGAVALPALSRIAGAQAYPARPLRWIVEYPPGGAADTVALGSQNGPARAATRYARGEQAAMVVLTN